MYCQKCGTEVIPNARFCSKCGEVIHAPDAGSLPATEPQPVPVRSPWKAVMITAAVIVVLVVALVGVGVKQGWLTFRPKGLTPTTQVSGQHSPVKQADGTYGTMTNAKDGAVMVWVPAGPFLMGSPDGVGENNEHPQHTVTLDGYWIYRDDVTVVQYRKFYDATKRAMPREPSYKWHGDNPMTMVSWGDAVAYAEWAGAALPTEAQWEKAARGTDGRNYPWGGMATAADPYNGWATTKCACWANSQDANGNGRGPHPVGSFPTGNSPYGARDMAGNVWQWCADWYDKDYYSASPSSNPTGPATGMVRALRGGSWGIGDVGDGGRCAFRGLNYPDDWGGSLGFRCVSVSPGP